MNPADRIALSRLAFDDIDHMVEWTREVGWDNTCTQLTAGGNHITYDHFALPDLYAAHYCVEQSIHNVFALPPGMVVFMLCREKLPLVWCGRHLPPMLMGIARSGLEHEVVLHAGWDCYEFMVTEELIRRTELFPPDFFDATKTFERAYLPLTEPATGRFLAGMDAFFDQGRSARGSTTAGIRRAEILDFVLLGLSQIIDAGLEAQSTPIPRRARRADLVARGREYVSANLHGDLTADDLAQALDVSYRVLNYGFKDSLGISPYQYILTRRLHAARGHLKSGIPGLKVCAMNGFSTPSRFSRQYRQLFGELPSETRRR